MKLLCFCKHENHSFGCFQTFTISFPCFSQSLSNRRKILCWILNIELRVIEKNVFSLLLLTLFWASKLLCAQSWYAVTRTSQKFPLLQVIRNSICVWRHFLFYCFYYNYCLLCIFLTFKGVSSSVTLSVDVMIPQITQLCLELQLTMLS